MASKDRKNGPKRLKNGIRGDIININGNNFLMEGRWVKKMMSPLLFGILKMSEL